MVYSLNQFSKKKVKAVKYDKKYINIKDGKVIPKKKGKTSFVLRTKSNKKKITVNIVKKVGFGVSTTIYRDVGKRVNLEFTCTKQEMSNILDMIRCKNWYSYAENPVEKKMGMSHQIGMYDFNGNKIVVIEVNPKIAWIRIPEDGSYMTPLGYTLPEFIKKI